MGIQFGAVNLNTLFNAMRRAGDEGVRIRDNRTGQEVRANSYRTALMHDYNFLYHSQPEPQEPRAFNRLREGLTLSEEEKEDLRVYAEAYERYLESGEFVTDTYQATRVSPRKHPLRALQGALGSLLRLGDTARYEIKELDLIG